MTLHVTDLDPHSLSKNGGLEDVSQVEKYRMSEEDYEKREGTLRAWKKKLLATDPERAYELFPSLRPKELPEGVAPVTEAASVEGIAVGSRCECSPGARRGAVAYVGKVKELGVGYWVGVKFDEPVGRSDGSVLGKVYFEAGKGYGGFLRGYNVAVGEYPPLELDLGDVMGAEESKAEPPAPASAAGAAGAAATAAPSEASAAAAAGGEGTAPATDAPVKVHAGSRTAGLRVVRRGVADSDDEDSDDDEL